jgi:hypothetical protein
MGFIYFSPKTFSCFPQDLLFFLFFNASINPSFVYLSSAACVVSSLLALKSFSSFAWDRFLRKSAWKYRIDFADYKVFNR